MEVSAGGQRALSEYFTVHNEEDSGLNTSVVCPTGKPNITDTNVVGHDDGEEGGSGRGYSAAELGGAVGGVAAFFVIAIALLYLFGRRKGWFKCSRPKMGGFETPDDAMNGGGRKDGDEEVSTERSELSTTKMPSVDQRTIGTADDEYRQYLRLYQKFGTSQMGEGKLVHQMP